MYNVKYLTFMINARGNLNYKNSTCIKHVY